MKVEFKGQNAGLSQESRGGNSNSPFDYFVTCGCGTPLGVLGAFSQNAEGRRTIYCPRCEKVCIMKDHVPERWLDAKDPNVRQFLFAGAKKVG